jgi:hypothetical protein
MFDWRRRALGAALFLAISSLPAAAQKLQWTDVVYVPGRWQAGHIVAPAGADSLALVMRLDYYAAAPRWRMEVRRTTDGVNFGDATIVLGEGEKALVVTQLGTTPLEQHALGRDSLVRAATAMISSSGTRMGPASGPIVQRRPNGSVVRVAYRRSVRTPTFTDDNLNPRNASAGRQLLSRGLTSVGDQRSAAVVATAGARGVDKVRTPKGEVAVKPDSTAVLRMEQFSVGAARLEEFLRTGALGPYRENGT